MFEESAQRIADDTVTGARHVKWLGRIEVRKVEKSAERLRCVVWPY